MMSQPHPTLDATEAHDSTRSTAPGPAPEAIREQVGRILSSALFRNSRRFPAFLRHTVEHALRSPEPLKERTIGHEVFGRDPAYDTAQDPVVRMTAAEVRKRLAQYYQAPEHSGELVISFQPGSYVPEFVVSARDPAPQPVQTTETQPAIPDPPRRRRKWWVAVALAVGSLAIAGAIATSGRSPSVDPVERFWSPIADSPDSALLCIGDPFSVRSVEPADQTSLDETTIEDFLQANAVRYTDATTLALLAAELRARHKLFRIRRPAATELKDLRDGPVVLIGGFNNPWTMRLSDGLRYTLAADTNGNYIRDRDRPADRVWRGAPRTTRLKDLKETFGIVTRMQDPATGHPVVMVSGLLFGTRAAAECITDGDCLRSAERMVEGGFGGRNVQIVVATAIIGEDSGAPRVLAAHAW